MSSSVIPEPKGLTSTSAGGLNETNNTTDHHHQQQHQSALNRDQASVIAASLTKPLKVNYRSILPFCNPPSTARNTPGELQVSVNEINQEYSVETPSLLDLHDFPTAKPDDNSYRGYMPFPENPKAKEIEDINFKIHQRELEMQARNNRRDSTISGDTSTENNNNNRSESRRISTLANMEVDATEEESPKPTTTHHSIQSLVWA